MTSRLDVLNTPGGHMVILLLGIALGGGMFSAGSLYGNAEMASYGKEVIEHAITLLLLRMGMERGPKVGQ